MADLNAKPEPPVRVRKKGQNLCRHQFVFLDDDARKVLCRDCDTEVNAFDAFLEFARQYERYESAKAIAEREAKEAEAKLAELRRAIVNAKSRLRTAKGKWPSAEEYRAAMGGRFPLPPSCDDDDADDD